MKRYIKTTVLLTYLFFCLSAVASAAELVSGQGKANTIMSPGVKNFSKPQVLLSDIQSSQGVMYESGAGSGGTVAIDVPTNVPTSSDKGSTPSYHGIGVPPIPPDSSAGQAPNDLKDRKWLPIEPPTPKPNVPISNGDDTIATLVNPQGREVVNPHATEKVARLYNGDLNNDGMVDIVDFSLARTQLHAALRYFGKTVKSTGDLNNDGRVDIVDFSLARQLIDLIQQNFGKQVQPYANGDINGDGIVDIEDFSLARTHLKAIKRNFGKIVKPTGDLNNDGRVDIVDFSLARVRLDSVMNNFGRIITTTERYGW